MDAFGVDMIVGLDLFSGIGGISLALKDIVKPIAYVEIDKYCQKVLKSKMKSGDLHLGEIHNDVKSFNGTNFRKEIDIIYGGFPCQDISVAGNGKGLEGERSGLFYEIVRLTKEIQPSFVFLENVPAIRRRGLFAVVSEFTELGYDCRWTVVSAREVGAPHLRKRWFLLAHASRKRLEGQGDRAKHSKEKHTEFKLSNEGVANSERDKSRLQPRRSSGPQRKDAPDYLDRSWWFSEPNVDRVVNGIPFRVDRVKALGNSVVPLTARTAFFKLLGDL